MLFTKKNETDFLLLLIKASENVLHAAQRFRHAMMGTEPPASYNAEIKELEHLGDKITHQIYQELSKVTVTPIDREDLMQLASKLDDVLDGIEASIARFDYLSITFTDKHMRSFSAVLVNSCQHILDAFKLLSKKKYIQIAEHTVQINALENEADRLMREGVRDIFANPKEPYHDFKLKELYEGLEETTDACEDVADILNSIVMKYS
ncbi:DUF47 domain-containing protein [Paenibacillus sp. YYML68]|uniref:DUF47 domain-containing protein n=1 Tax=Paenibacillus sp. YYML68 TaxID=2909250 RepID=UPI00249371BC|nr:DUF47 family protein [Paenibacillus sp. YYML68]